MNWYNIYFNEILGNYDFDGVIFAIFDDNLSRNFFVLDTDYSSNKMKGGYIDYFPKNQKDLNQNSLQNGLPLYKSTQEINNAIHRIENNTIHFPKLKSQIPLLLEDLKYIKNYIEFIYSSPKLDNENLIENYSKNNFKNRYVNDKYALIDTMLMHMMNNKKKIIFLNVPENEDIKRFKDVRNHTMKQELIFLSKNYNGLYYDSFNDFSSYENSQLNEFWFKYDGHLNDTGSEVLALKLSEFLISVK
jgi:hypothetical protein